MTHRLSPESFQRTSRILPFSQLGKTSQRHIRFLAAIITLLMSAVLTASIPAGAVQYNIKQLTNTANSPKNLTNDNNYLYWSNHGYVPGIIEKVGINGGSVIRLVEINNNWLTVPLVKNGNIYWTEPSTNNYNGIYHDIKSTGTNGGSIIALESHLNSIRGMAVVGGYLYYVNRVNNDDIYQSSDEYNLKRKLINSANIPEIICGNFKTPFHIKNDGNSIYLVEYISGVSESIIKKISLSDFSISTIVGEAGWISELIFDGNYLYYVIDKNIKKIDKNGNNKLTMENVFTGQSNPILQSDGSNIYFIDAIDNNINSDYSVKKISTNGGPITIIYNTGRMPGLSLAIDGYCIYVASQMGTILKLYPQVEVPYLSFDQNPPNPSTVGTAFPVTISAHKADGTLDTSFNANVNLSCQPLEFDKASVLLTNGTWTGTLTINHGEGAKLVIQAGGGGLSGKSNSFSTAGAATAVGNLYGVVTDDGAIVNTPLPNATVHLSLSPNGPDAYPTKTTNANGQFSFNGVAAGTYYLWATCYGSSSPPDYQVTISSGSMAKSLTVPTAGDPSKLPVILVPGITGSNDKDRYVVYPRLSKADYDRNQLQLHDPGGKAGWQDLREILGKNGKNVKVVDCPWDWRKPIDAAMKKYLKDAIREAKGGNANQKVNIIAHSMGGLLARAYIQGDDYQNDVENLVLVGTPHTGSANAYYFWEGGDPETVDNFSPFGNIVGYYSNTIKKLMQDLKWPLTGEQDYQNKRTFISSHMPTARQLLPTYAFLDHGSGPQPIATSWDINYDLKDLNNDPRRSERMGPPNTTTPGVVKTRVYYSGSENTVGNVHVRNTTLQGCYEDGQPDGSVAYVLGDGTVKTTSATLPVQENWADGIVMPGECDHLSLIKNAKNLIADFLYPTVAKAMVFKEAAAATLSPSFFMTYDGWLQPYLADSQGRAVGFNLTSGALENTIPQARLVTEGDYGSLAVENPADGTYALYLKGKFSGAYRVTIGYQSGGNFVTRDLAGFNSANITTITVTVDSTNPQKITINPQVLAPTAVTASNVQGKTYLTWQASAGAVSYQIYAMRPGSSDFTLIGSTADTNLLTNDPWLLDSSALPTMYVVVAVKADGATSFFSNTAVNKTIPNKKINMAPIYSLLLTD